MENMNTPPILAFFSIKTADPPSQNPREIQRDPTPNWLSVTPPKIGENGLHPPKKIYDPPSGCF